MALGDSNPIPGATPPAPDAQALVERIAGDPALAARLAQALTTNLPAAPPLAWWQRSQPLLAALSSAAVVLLAFLLPSIQDQWDRYRSRAAVDRYEQIGRDLTEQGHYASAEQAFGRAVDLAGTQRLDLLEAQLKARVLRVNEDPEWLGAVPGDVTESDFIYLLELEDEASRPLDRAATQSAYGVFLVGLGRWTEAEARLREAIRLAPSEATAHVNLGNLLGDLDRPAEAEAEFRAALRLDPKEPAAHYDLGLFLADAGRAAEAEQHFRAYTELEPAEADGFERLGEQLQVQGKQDLAREALARAARLNPQGARERRAAAEAARRAQSGESSDSASSSP